jgi:hypothetical protein
LAGLAQLDGNPKPGVMILSSSRNPRKTSTTICAYQSDSDGTFNLRDILPGKYFLMAIDGGWDLDWANPAVLKSFHDQAQVIQIARDDSIKVTLAVQRPTKNVPR